jgi:CBS domain-containing protein
VQQWEDAIVAQTVAEIMTSGNLATVERTESAAEAARRMAAADAGDVIVLDNGAFIGILTDRDIAIRLVANNRSPATPVSEIASDVDVVTVTPQTSLDEAIELIRNRSVRRLPVLERGRAVGVVSLGDLAMERDPNSVVADISAAPGNT